MKPAEQAVLVTGATTGIGRATVLAFAARGARICFTGLGAADGQAVLDQARAEGAADVIFLEADVRHEAQLQSVIDRAVARFGRIHVAVNNAGVETPLGPIHESSDEQFEHIMGVNVRGTWLALKHEIRHMLQQGSGSIVNTASTAGVTGIPGVALYTASKHAIVGLTKAAALEVAGSNIRINAVAPGPVRTGLLSRMLDGKLSIDEVASRVPMGRVSDPAEIAAAIVWLGSEAASFVIGHTLLVDGGLTAA